MDNNKLKEIFEESELFKKDKSLKLVNNTIYDKDGKRIGTFFPPAEQQIDTLSYTPLSDKVLQILTGDPNFHAEDVNEDYDEEESDWKEFNPDSEENLEIDAVSDDYFDKDDAFDLNQSMSKKIKQATEITKIVEGADSNIEAEEIQKTVEEKTE